MHHRYHRKIAVAFLCAGLTASVAAAELVVSQVAPFSGPLAPTGSHIKAGAQLYFDVVNAGGGIHGAKIKLTSRDDGYKAPETLRLTQEALKDDRPVALFGIVGTGNVETLLKEKTVEGAGIPLVTMRSGAASVVNSGNPWLFHTRASYADEVGKILQQYLPLGYKRVAVFYQDDSFGLDGLAAAEAKIKELGGELAAKAGYEKNTTKVEAAVKAIAAANPALVVMVSNTAASAEFVKQFRATGNLAQLVALSVTDAGQVIDKVGKATAHGLAVTQVVPDPNNGAVPLVREIRDAIKKFPLKDASLNHTFIEGYLGAKVLVEGLRRAGPNPTPKKLRDALEGIRDLDAGGVLVSFSATKHAGSHYADIIIINKDGALVR